jgi:hypothetical protein
VLAAGLPPTDMDNKWWSVVDGQTMRLHRSWTGQLVHVLTFEGVSSRRATAAWSIDKAVTGEELTGLIEGEVLALGKVP